MAAKLVIKEPRRKQKRVEANLQKQCLDYLMLCGCFVMRMNTGAMVGEYKGRKRVVRFGVKGMSDIIGVTPIGRFIAVEVKRPGQRPTEEQDRFIEAVLKHDGIAFWVDTFEGFAEICKQEDLRPGA